MYYSQYFAPTVGKNGRAYLAAFFRFFFALPCGFGGVLSILRSTSSGLGAGFGFSCVMARV